MAPLKALAAWYPPERQASYSGWIMLSGGLGALASTVPVELALRVVDWRTLFLILAAMTLAVAVFIYVRVPDIDKPTHSLGLEAQAAGVRDVLTHPRFWWIAPLAGLAMGSFMAIQGLWAVPWMMEVDGMSRAAAADYLLAMNTVIMLAYLGLGLVGTELARRGIHARHLYAAGFAINFGSLALIVLGVPGALVWWSLYGLGAAANVLGFTALGEGFPRELTGRLNTTLNLMMFGGSFIAQWGIGIVVDATRVAFGLGTAGGLRVAFATVLACYTLAFLWFIHGWRRHTRRPAAILPA